MKIIRIKKHFQIFSFFLVCFPIFTSGQNSGNMIAQNFVKVTGIELPNNFGDFRIVKLENLKGDASSFKVSYVEEKNKSSRIMIIIYPADIAVENRSLNEHIYKNLSNYDGTTEIVNQPFKVSKDSFNTIGLLSTFSDIKTNSNIAIATFEAGKYFIKYEMKSKQKSIAEVTSLIKTLVDTISPVSILKKNPLILGITIHVAPGIIRDTNSLDPIIKATLTKIKWVHENVDSLEKCSGFPSLYFLEQKLSIEAMLTEWESVTRPETNLENYFKELITIRDSGFLNEYIYQQYDHFLLLPDNQKLRMEDFAKWSKDNKTTVSLRGPVYYYKLGFEESYKN